MKKIIILIIVFCNHTFLVAGQTWQWALSDGSTNVEQTISLCTDVLGNVYTSGYFGEGPAPVNFGVFAGDTLYLQGATDIFIASYDQNGNGNWAKRAGTNTVGFNYLFETGYLCSNIADSSIFLYGFYAGNFSLDTFFFPGDPNKKEFFISKFNYGGNCLWVKRATSLQSTGTLKSMSSDQTGKSYLTGIVDSAGVLDSINIPAGGFVSRINADGKFLWAKRVYDIWESGSWQIKATPSGFIASGVFIDTAYIDTIPVISKGSHDIFVASFDSLGSVQWVKTFGGNSSDYGSKLSLDANNNIYISASFVDTLYLDSVLFTNSNRDLVLIKLDPVGNLIWARQLIATGDAQINDIDADQDGNVYITGRFSQSITFGSNTLSTMNNLDMFLARYNSSGNCLGVRQLANVEGTNVVSDQGGVIVSGLFSGSMTLGSTTLTSNGITDMFIARHDAFTGVGEIGLERNSGLFIYANPTTGKCTINIPDEFINDLNLTLRVYNSLGKLIKEYPISQNEGKIFLNLDSEAKGTYIAKIDNGTKQYTGRIVFE